MDYKPDDYPSLSPYLLAEDVGAVLAFCETVFGAERLRVFHRGDQIAHGELRIDDSVLMVGGPVTAPPAMLHLYLPDPDAVMARALEQGAELIEPMTDHADGDRRGGFRAPDGTAWYVSRRIG